MTNTTTISASDVNRLRQITGAGIMDCKKALTEGGGDFDKAIEILRKKGQKIAATRAQRDAKEGIVLAKISENGKKGIMVSVNCETDFVARNKEFSSLAETIANIALEKLPANIDELKSFPFSSSLSINEAITELMGKIGEKLELSRYEIILAEKVVAYNHPGNKLAAIVGFTKNISDEVGKNIAMQIAAMAPISVDKDDVPKEIIEREMEIGRELARKEGKPENMIDKIAMGKLNKFYSEFTLLNQEFIRDAKKTIRQYLAETDKEVKIAGFRRIALG